MIKIDKQKKMFLSAMKFDQIIDDIYKKYKKILTREEIRTLFLKSKTCEMILDFNTRYWIEPEGFLREEFEKELKRYKKVKEIL